jgi:hypothetical protein
MRKDFRDYALILLVILLLFRSFIQNQISIEEYDELIDEQDYDDQSLILDELNIENTHSNNNDILVNNLEELKVKPGLIYDIEDKQQQQVKNEKNDYKPSSYLIKLTENQVYFYNRIKSIPYINNPYKNLKLSQS